jgi:DNA-binding FadR family transcriptional regulator
VDGRIRENGGHASCGAGAGIRRVDLPEARQAIPHVHAYLREDLQRQLRAFTDRITRYIRIYQLSALNDWRSAGEAEYAGILEALIAGDERGAVIAMAHHLAGAALRVLTRAN